MKVTIGGAEIDVLAIYAAIVATVVAVVRIIDWFQAGERLHFSVYPADVMSEAPDYKLKPHSKAVIVAVGNRAPFPLHVTHIAFKLRRGTALMQLRPPAGTPTLPKKLEPSEGLSWVMVPENIRKELGEGGRSTTSCSLPRRRP